MINRSNHLFFIPLIIAITSFTLFIVAVVQGWMGLPKGVGSNFCEFSNGLIKQPVNTWSCFGVIYVGLLMAWMLMKGRFSSNKNKFTKNNFTAILFTSSVILMGPASMSLHATLTPIGGKLDSLSMYLVAAFMMSYSIYRYFNIKFTYAAIIYFLVVGLCEWASKYNHGYHPKHWGNIAIAFFILIALSFELLNILTKKYKYEIRWFIFSLISMSIAFFILSIWTSNSWLCNPKSYLQGHAIWQMLGALALYFLFRFYVSETVNKINN